MTYLSASRATNPLACNAEGGTLYSNEDSQEINVMVGGHFLQLYSASLCRLGRIAFVTDLTLTRKDIPT